MAKKIQLTPEERKQKEQEICNLTCDLATSNPHSFGDYQMIRFIDAIVKTDKFWELFGDAVLPKTREEIMAIIAERETKRQRIKELQEELKE